MNAPEKIYRQWCDCEDCECASGDVPVTHCVDRINEHDIEYVRADLVEALRDELGSGFWECPLCAFRMSADHADPDSNEYPCPLCELDDVEKERDELQATCKAISKHFRKHIEGVTLSASTLGLYLLNIKTLSGLIGDMEFLLEDDKPCQ